MDWPSADEVMKGELLEKCDNWPRLKFAGSLQMHISADFWTPSPKVQRFFLANQVFYDTPLASRRSVKMLFSQSAGAKWKYMRAEWRQQARLKCETVPPTRWLCAVKPVRQLDETEGSSGSLALSIGLGSSLPGKSWQAGVPVTAHKRFLTRPRALSGRSTRPSSALRAGGTLWPRIAARGRSLCHNLFMVGQPCKVRERPPVTMCKGVIQIARHAVTTCIFLFWYIELLRKLMNALKNILFVLLSKLLSSPINLFCAQILILFELWSFPVI